MTGKISPIFKSTLKNSPNLGKKVAKAKALFEKLI